jgi:hypothetical protein
MNYGYGNGSVGAIVSLFLGVYFSILGFVLLLSLVVYVLNGLSMMKLFRKLGVEPWAAWVPFFNIWRLLELGGQQGWFSLFVLISPGAIVTAVFEGFAVYRIGLAFRKSGSWVVLFFFLPFVWAWLLAADDEVYDVHLPGLRGYGPPLAGYGSARGPYVPYTPDPPAPPAA